MVLSRFWCNLGGFEPIRSIDGESIVLPGVVLQSQGPDRAWCHVDRRRVGGGSRGSKQCSLPEWWGCVTVAAQPLSTSDQGSPAARSTRHPQAQYGALALPYTRLSPADFH